MATANATAAANEAEAALAEGSGVTIIDQIAEWFREEGAWWLASLVAHMLGMCILAMITVNVGEFVLSEAPAFDEVDLDKDKDKDENKIDKFEVGETPEDPTELSTETLTLEPPGQIEQTEQYNDDSAAFTDRGGGVVTNANMPALGGLGGFDVKGVGQGPAFKGAGGVGVGVGFGKDIGSGGDGVGFGGRGTGHRKAMLGRFGGTRQSERAVAAALNWFARHQSSDGRWSIEDYRKKCTDQTCTGPGTAKQDVGGTALGLLCFLAAGQTHVSNGPYRQHIYKAIFWLIGQQKADGDLRGGGSMYSHGLAAIALCEVYGMTGDKTVAAAAQKSIAFIQGAQHPGTGGWRYAPGDEGDTSVVGWQVMALKSGQMSGLHVNPAALENSRKFLKSCSSGYHGEQFSYLPHQEGTEAMTAVGLLCSQYLGAKRGDPQMTDGATYLMNHMPDEKRRNTYYWYYATQVMHNLTGPQWDTWNRAMRRILIGGQVKEGCAAGSWDPAVPAKDPWGDQGGRILVTSLCCLTLEVYYRYMPLFKLDTEDDAKPGAKPAEKPADKPAEKPADKPAEKPAGDKGDKKA